MGEQEHFGEENNTNSPKNDVSDQEMNSDNEDNADLDDMDPEDFQLLDNQLDALNSALDDIEQKNDNLHAQLLELLESNREIRKQLKESTSHGVGNGENLTNN